MTLHENLERLEDRIASACRTANRSRSEVELMAVSKTFPVESILEAASLGLTLFGENRVQEWASKATAFDPKRESTECRCHLIGHLQSNKAQRAAELFDGIDSLDTLRLAERLNEAAAKLNKRLPVLLEVKLSPEETKAGLDPESFEAAQLLERLPDLANLQTSGLMTIAPWGAPDEVTRACFRSLRTWRDRWATTYPRLNLPILSMGMSGDFELAIAEGATRIRIGTDLFGKRSPQAIRAAAEADAAGESLMLRANANGVTLAVRAQPGAKKTAFAGLYGEGIASQLKIAVHAPPLEGRANAALIEFLAETFSLPKNAIELVTGDSSRSKVFQIRGITLAQANVVIARHLGS